MQDLTPLVTPLAAVVCLLALLSYPASGQPDLDAADNQGLSEKALKKLVNEHPDSALLHAKLGSVYFSQGTVEGRVRAAKQLERALRLEPDNSDFRRLLAEVYFEGTFWRYGVEQLRRALETDSRNGFIRYRLGKAYLDRAIEEWQTEWFVAADFQLGMVDSQHQAYCAATRQLALCYYDLGKPDSAAALIRSMPEDSLDVDALLVLGMALQVQSDIAGAHEVFTRALQMMDDDQHERFTTPDLLASRDELRELAAIHMEGDRNKRELFWRKRDPNQASKVNERLVEHMSRVAFAELHFSVPRLDRPGSKTSRGEVYIRYGMPLAWHFDPFGTNVFCGETAEPLRRSTPTASEIRDPFYDFGFDYRSRSIKAEKPRWVWQYKGFVLEFEDAFLNGDFTFPYERDWSAYTYAYLEKRIPEIYESQIKKNMRVVLDALNLMGPRGDPYLKINYACDTRGVEYTPGFEWPKGDFEIEIAVLDSFYQDIARKRFTAELFADSAAIYQTKFPLIGSQIIQVPPGMTVAAVSIESKANGAMGFTHGTTDIRTYGDHLEMSDLELRFAEEGPPNPSRVYLRRGEAYMGFIVYNLMMDVTGTGEAEVSYKITKRPEVYGRFRRILYMFIGEPDDESAVASVWSKYDLRSRRPTAYEVVGIDLSSLSSGFYDVEVTVLDKTSGRSVTRQTVLSIASELGL